MKFTEKIQGLISRGEIQDASTNMLEDTIGAVLGDPISVGKIMLAIVKSPFFIREQLFWTKMEAFLNGVYLNENDCVPLLLQTVRNKTTLFVWWKVLIERKHSKKSDI